MTAVIAAMLLGTWPAQDAKALVESGRARLARREFKEAIEKYERVLREAPQDSNPRRSAQQRLAELRKP